MNDDLEISIATSSGTRECFACGSRIWDRTFIIKGRKLKDEIVLHEKCFKNLSVLMQHFTGDKK